MTIDTPYTQEDAFIELMRDKNFQRLVKEFELEIDFTHEKDIQHNR